MTDKAPRAAPCIAPLFVPADRPERFAKAASSGADAVIIDLEDAVAPENKASARLALSQAQLPAGITIYVRINATGTDWHEADLAALSRPGLAGIMLPKTETAEQIRRLAEKFPGFEIIALIESAAGLVAARQTAGAATRLAFGSIDFCADLGLSHTREALLMARSELVLASRLGGLPPPLDGVTAAIGDANLATDDARHAASLGFGGKLCIHPLQIAAILQGFAPSAADYAWATRILAASGDGAAQIGGEMVDAPVRQRARRIIARYLQ